VLHRSKTLPTSLSDEQMLVHYKQQQGVERGFRFLKDPLFFASSVFLKTPERIMALTFIMALSFAKTLTMPYDDLKI
jgi:transposase